MTGPYKIQYFKDRNGKSPFLEWRDNLEDQVGRAKIKVQVDRLERGNFGRCRSLGGGLHEAKIRFGPGYRIYFGMADQQIIIILCGGSKRSQKADIEKAKGHWVFIQQVVH